MPSLPAAPEDGRRARIGLALGPAVLAAVLVATPPAGLSVEGWRVVGVGLWMAIWWVTEAIPLAATALLPLVAFPVLGAASGTESAAPYANPVVFLFLGGFLLGAALAGCGLHRRLALAILRLVGGGPRRLVGGFMAVTALLSLGVSNTATVVMMLPIATPVIALVDRPHRRGFATALLLGIAYAASLGGLGTLIGTPPNALLAGYLAETTGRPLGFAEWMTLGLPLVAVSLPACWALLVFVLNPIGGADVATGAAELAREHERLGRLSGPEARVATVATVVSAAWIFRPLLEGVVPGLSDAGIAIGGAVALFLMPGREGRLLDADDLQGIPWGVLLLFGGGLSLASAIERTGVATWLGGHLETFGGWPAPAVIAVVTAGVVLLTELTSNTATAAALLPVAGATALAMGVDPRLLAVPTALAASCAFMMPVATPPNAIVYGTGELRIGDMVRAGIWLNLMMTVAIVVAVILWVRAVG